MNSNRKIRKILIFALVAAIFFWIAGSYVKADFVLGTPENIGPAINTSGYESIVGISMDYLSFYFLRIKTPYELWVSTRVNKNDPWSAAQYLGTVTLNDLPTAASPFDFLATMTTADGLECYFGIEFPGGYGRQDIWVMKRETIYDAWGPLENLGPPVNTIYDEHLACISPDGLELYFSGFDEEGARPNGYGHSDLWITRRATRDAPWTEPNNLGPMINSAYIDGRPSISPDGLLLFFDSDRPGGYGSLDLYVSRRATLSDQWGVPMNLGPLVNTAGIEECARISPDGSILYWDTDRPDDGDNDLWQIPIIPLVDLNGSGFFDIDDLVIVIKNWDTNEPSCDIAPTPFGNGIVDKKDLEVFMSYWGQEVNDPNLIAYFPLDETDGTNTQEKVTGEFGFIFGEPILQPDGGMVNGALEFDGIDDCVITNFYFNPSEGPFSTFAWIKGGLPGQTIISQANGADWLSADIVDGTLTTELQGEGINGSILLSQTVITDDDWHRIGLVWDGLNRFLYVDDEAVAQDIQADLSSSEDGLLIGTGNNMETGFWTGLIDEVRIYNRAITP